MRLFHPPLGLQFTMGHVTSVHQGLSSTRAKSLGTRLRKAAILKRINWVLLGSSLIFYFVTIQEIWGSTIGSPLKMRAETYTRPGTSAPASKNRQNMSVTLPKHDMGRAKRYVLKRQTYVLKRQTYVLKRKTYVLKLHAASLNTNGNNILVVSLC